MAEAMAIVMAPTDPRQKIGIFRLTTPGGMDTILRCNDRGFHAHQRPDTGQEIYELCDHVYLDEGLDSQFDSIDLR
jgi:STAM-binding protein